MHQNVLSAPLARQRGAALLVFMLIALIAALSLLLNRLALRSAGSSNQATMNTLVLAKDALIGWSATNATAPGRLPCPEDPSRIGTTTEGQAKSSCGNSLQVGRLPWRTLGLPLLRDDAGEPLWYALSAGFRSSPINGNSAGQLTVDSVPNRAIAIIFSPGTVLSGQSRPIPTSALSPDIMQYLEGFNLSGNGSFVTSGALNSLNDRLVTITREDLFRVVNRRILSELRGDDGTGLVSYYNANGNTFPPAGSNLTTLFPPLLSTATTNLMANNNWYSLLSYSVSPDLKTATLTITAPNALSCKITPSPSTPPICQ
ncbi:MAG: hypothetical protein WCK63_14105 [Betaproteobacteria bacterium]